MKVSPSVFAFALFCIFLSLLPPALPSQDFSSLDGDLTELETLIYDTIRNSEEQRKQLEDLQRNLIESGELIGTYESIIAERENLLKDLQIRLNELSETYRKQSALSAKYEKNSRFWRTFTLIAVPTAALLSGGLVWLLK